MYEHNYSKLFSFKHLFFIKGYNGKNIILLKDRSNSYLIFNAVVKQIINNQIKEKMYFDTEYDYNFLYNILNKSNNISDSIDQNNTYIILDNTYEYCSSYSIKNDLMLIKDIFSGIGFDLNKKSLIFLCTLRSSIKLSCYQCELPNVKTYIINEFMHLYKEKSETIYIKDIDKQILDKKFLMMCNRPREHRMIILDKIINNNLIEDFYISFFPHKNLSLINDKDRNLKINYRFLNYFLNGIAKNKKFDIFNHINNITENIPKYLDEKISQPHNYSDKSLYLYYERIFSELILDTHVYYNQETYELNEKIFRPIVHKVPFIVFGEPYTIKRIKDLGFDTFDDIFDHSYDNNYDIEKRIELLIKETKKISKLSRKDLLNIKKSISHRLLENKNHLTYRLSDDYNKFIDHISIHS